MNRFTPLTEINSFAEIATDFNDFLPRHDNQDVKLEFPTTVKNYGMGVESAIRNLEEARNLYKTGEREQFIISSGERAVGLCIITSQLKQPLGIDASWPNISGFIVNPFRGRGLGRFSIEERMKVVENNFNNHAWTFVRHGNKRSEHLVLSVGFKKLDQVVEGHEDKDLFIFDGNR